MVFLSLLKRESGDKFQVVGEYYVEDFLQKAPHTPKKP